MNANDRKGAQANANERKRTQTRADDRKRFYRMGNILFDFEGFLVALIYEAGKRGCDTDSAKEKRDVMDVTGPKLRS